MPAVSVTTAEIAHLKSGLTAVYQPVNSQELFALERMALTQQAISKHLKVLERAGLISRSAAAQSRPCRLEPAQLDTAAEWIGRHRQVWAARFDRLDDHLTALGQAPARPQSPPSREKST